MERKEGKRRKWREEGVYRFLSTATAGYIEL